MLEVEKGMSILYKDGDHYYRVYIKKRILKKPEVHIAKFESKNAKCGTTIPYYRVLAAKAKDLCEQKDT